MTDHASSASPVVQGGATHVLLTLIVPTDLAQAVEDLLLDHPDLVPGFTTGPAAGHGSAVQLVSAAERVSGHAPRLRVQMAGSQEAMEAVLALLGQSLPRANIFYWLVPVLASGRIA